MSEPLKPPRAEPCKAWKSRPRPNEYETHECKHEHGHSGRHVCSYCNYSWTDDACTARKELGR